MNFHVVHPFIKSGVSIFGVNGSAASAEILQNIGFYNFYGKQYIEVPVKEAPLGIIIGHDRPLWQGGVNNTGNLAIYSISYLPSVYSNNNISSGLYVVWGKAVLLNESYPTSAGFSGYTNTTSGTFKKPTYSNGKLKIDLTGSEYYFYPYQYASGKINVVVLYEGISGKYYNTNV